MGNWRTVNMVGHMAPAEADDMIQELSRDNGWYTPAECFTMGESLYGLDQWVNDDGTIDAIGNLAERDYNNDDIENGLTYLAQKYPSLTLTLHSGSDWEELECTATFHVANGRVERCDPEVEKIHGIPEGQSMMRLMKILNGG